MLTETQTLYNSRLVGIAEELDISPSKYQQAVDRYEAVGDWLDRQESPLRLYRPRIHPQGSFRLGTVVRPVKACKEADYDIDLVCQLDIAKDSDQSPTQTLPRRTARELKHLVGDRLKENGTYQKMLDEEGKRCWTLQYSEQDGVGFHMDILPSAPEEEAIVESLEANGVSSNFAYSAIGITNRDKNAGQYLWLSSNPEGYARWFDDRVALIPTNLMITAKQMLFESNRMLYASVDHVPDRLVRTPLQRAIQILKRHRDVRFVGARDENNKPISMIITTLAALLYEGETDLYTALVNIVSKLSMHAGLVENRHFTIPDSALANRRLIQRVDGRWYIGNPVNPLENFADRWHENDHAKAKAFFKWVAQVGSDLIDILQQRSAGEAISSVSGLLLLSSTRPATVKAIPRDTSGYPRVTISNPNRPWSN